MPEHHDRWARVAEAVTARMEQLGIEGRADLARRSGLSDPTLRQYMTGTSGRRGVELPAMPRADTLQPLARALRWQSDWWDSIVAGQQPNPWEDGHVDDSLGERVAEALRSSVIDVLIRMRFDQLAKMAGCAAWFSASAQHEPAKDLQSAAPGVRWADYAPSLDLFLDSHPAIDELNRAANQLWSAARRQWDAAAESTKSDRGTPSLQLAAQGSRDPRAIDPSTDENAPGKRPSPPSEDSDQRR